MIAVDPWALEATVTVTTIAVDTMIAAATVSRSAHPEAPVTGMDTPLTLTQDVAMITVASLVATEAVGAETTVAMVGAAGMTIVLPSTAIPLIVTAAVAEAALVEEVAVTTTIARTTAAAAAVVVATTSLLTTAMAAAAKSRS